MFLIEIQFNMCYARKHIFPCITHIKLHFCQNTVCFHLAAANRLGISAEVTFAFGREFQNYYAMYAVLKNPSEPCVIREIYNIV